MIGRNPASRDGQQTMIQHSHKDVFGKVRALIAPNLPLTTVSSGHTPEIPILVNLGNAVQT
jgi:hypothetical protein